MPASRFSEVNPQFAEYREVFRTLRDSYLGERHIKKRGTTYLPKTPGQLELSHGTSGTSIGDKLYEQYKARAVYHDDFRKTIRALSGMMHRELARIEVPSVMEPMLELATPEGETMQDLLRRINEEQLITGRYGLQLEVDDTRSLPYIVGWRAEHIRNWNENNETRENEIRKVLKFVTLDESRFEINPLGDSPDSWQYIEIYRRLSTDDAGNYIVQVERDGNLLEPVMPMLAGSRYEGIPFRVANSTDILLDIQDPPLEGLANILLAVYRGEADYREALFRTGQDTLVLIGAPLPEDESGKTPDRFVGSNAIIELPIDGDAKYIGVSGDGLDQMRQSVEADRAEAGTYGAALFEADRGAETDEALRTRASGRTANLVSIARTGAATLELILRDAARWLGANEDEVRVDPNLEFLTNEMSAEELAQLMGAKTLGAPISIRTIHQRMLARGMTELQFDDEMAEIRGEEPLVDPNIDDDSDGDLAGEDDGDEDADE